MDSTSFFKGSLFSASSLRSCRMNVLLLLFWAAFSRRGRISCCFFFTGLPCFSQAAFLPSLTCFLMDFSISSNSSSEAIFPAIIHSRIFTLQSCSLSQFNLSSLLYRSWDPEVECPCGCVSC